MAHARFDKLGRRLPDTGHGCGCSLCAESNAPRYERRVDAMREGGEWGSLQRRIARFVRSFSSGRPTLA
ncbi:MAG: hypothetical protein E6J12_04060 [Chloroflexi bacterium]|nr:MAG: hypothetical protein E6J12_04060 [Chloroflexota bacterium]